MNFFEKVITYGKKLKTVYFFNKYFLNCFPFKCYIAGGSVRDFIIYNKILGDVDIFFSNEEEIKKALSWIGILDKYGTIRYNGKVYSSIACFISKYPIIYCDWGYSEGLQKYVLGGSKFKRKFELNFVLYKMFDTPQELINNFDFSICKSCIYEGSLIIGDNFFRDLKLKQIINEQDEFSVSEVRRIVKYLDKGYILTKEHRKDILNKFSFNKKNHTFDDYAYSYYDYKNDLKRLKIKISPTCVLERI